ncbi:hypothetical protein AcW1_002435 [Taiwanofungus camphoratus]|nr:hypothetical protein AcV5_009908 [Antrodia cinnamomea]KAI0943220.1 hypothetical protein AcW1_002435 [Antrodia cinnamomea]
MFVVRVLSVITALAFSVLTSATPLIPSAGGHGLSRAATPPHAVFKRHEFVPLVSRDAPSGLAAIMTTIKNNIAPLADQLGAIVQAKQANTTTEDLTPATQNISKVLEAGIAEMTALAGQPAEVILGAGVSASVTADAISQLVDELEGFVSGVLAPLVNTVGGDVAMPLLGSIGGDLGVIVATLLGLLAEIPGGIVPTIIASVLHLVAPIVQ